MGKEIILQAKGVCKSFGPTVALNNLDITIRGGEIHGLIGENGSGKSTFASIAAGSQKNDAGEMYVGGKRYEPGDIQSAVRDGICMIVQEQGTLNGLTVAANIFLGQEGQFCKYKILNIGKMYRAAEKALTLIQSSQILPNAMVDKLSFEDRKLLEIARAMYTEPQLLIVDETTTALPSRGREILYSIMRSMRKAGKAVLFITHDIEEIQQFCDVVTILRDGNTTGHLRKEEMQTDKMKRLMVGRDVKENFYRADYDGSVQKEVLLSVENIYTPTIKNISLQLHKGEILGIGGLTDCGMHELGKVIYGRINPKQGTVRVKGSKICSVRSALDKRIGYLAKDRDQEALMQVCSIEENICLPALTKIKKHGFITKGKERAFIGPWVEKLNIKMQSTSQYCMYLSGGNKQKVSLAKWLANDSEILILDCPTRGIDIGVKSDIYKLMSDLKASGKGIILISEELPELIGMSDRILTLKDGRVTAEFLRSEELSEQMVIEHII